MKQITLLEQQELSPIMKDVYRRLRTNVEFTGLENRVICITSCLPNDGKSIVSYYLARSFAEDGKTVLLIDADMRNSTFCAIHGIDKSIQGLSNFLSGREKLADVIFETNKAGFYVMPTGVFPVNPTELLNKPRFAKMIGVLKGNFDYVIIDTPPLGAVVDSAVVARECDGSVLVVAADKISRRAAADVRKQLKQANDNLLGVVLNQVDTKSKSYGYGYGYGSYGYGYGYGYGSSYGEKPTKNKSKEK